MITPSYGLTATERVLPKLALDFTTASLDLRVTFTRTGNTATVTNSSGVIVGINADLPRFDYDPTTLVCKGLLIEESRTNVLLNSSIDGTSLATQIVTVTAAARTLSFYGSGTIVLSGTHSATVNGSGAYPTRTTLTFTPSAGALTLTVTGTVQFAQLETASYATSFIPTEATAVTRNADLVKMTGTNFSDWFNATEGTFQIEATTFATSYANAGVIFNVNDTTGTNQMGTQRTSALVSNSFVTESASQQYTGTLGALVINTPFKVALAYKLNNVAAGTNGAATPTDTSCNVPIVNQINIGNRYDNGRFLNGWFQKINFYNQRITNAELAAFTK
jgi:hypothetical protein